MSATSGLALRTTSGRPEIESAIFRQRSHPDDPGRCRSRITAENGLSRSLASPVTLSVTTSTSYRSREKSRCKASRKALSSAMTRIRSIVAGRSSDSGVFKVAARVVVAIAFPLSVDRRLIHSFIYTERKPLSCAWVMRQASRYVVRLGTALERLANCPSSPGEP